MKINKQYVFDIQNDITGPCATDYGKGKIGVWQMDVDNEVGQVNINMTVAQAKSLVHDLTLLLPVHEDQSSVCKLVNDRFSWIMYVDGETISIDDPDYFAQHYSDLGYIIEWDKDKWKRDE